MLQHKSQHYLLHSIKKTLKRDVNLTFTELYETISVSKVVAVSTERYLAICRPLQYKPSPIFYILLVFLTSIGVNFGRFLEYRTVFLYNEEKNISEPFFTESELMSDER